MLNNKIFFLKRKNNIFGFKSYQMKNVLKLTAHYCDAIFDVIAHFRYNNFIHKKSKTSSIWRLYAKT